MVKRASTTRASKGPAKTTSAGAKRRRPMPIFEDRVLHFPGALTARDLEQMTAHFASNEVRGELFDAVLHDSTNARRPRP